MEYLWVNWAACVRDRRNDRPSRMALRRDNTPHSNEACDPVDLQEKPRKTDTLIARCGDFPGCFLVW